MWAQKWTKKWLKLVPNAREGPHSEDDCWNRKPEEEEWMKLNQEETKDEQRTIVYLCGGRLFEGRRHPILTFPLRLCVSGGQHVFCLLIGLINWL